MIRSEKDFLDNLLGLIMLGRHGLAESGHSLEKIEQAVRNRLVIYSGQPEGKSLIGEVYDLLKESQAVKIEGKPLSETIIEDRG